MSNIIATMTCPYRGSANRTPHEGALYWAHKMIAEGDGDYGRRIHNDKQSPAPFSAVVEGNGRGAVLRLGVLTAEAFNALAQVSEQYQLYSPLVMAYPQMYQQAADDTKLTLHFKTPTGFSKGGQTDVMPTAERVFGSLARRWATYCHAPVVPDLQYYDVRVLSLSVRTEAVKLERLTMRGVVGKMILIVPKEVAKWYCTLAKFGELAGVGQKTSMGFGQMRVE